jgi:CRP-like cAMP-binding protein
MRRFLAEDGLGFWGGLLDVGGARTVNLAKGEVLFHQGDPVEWLYRLDGGCVRLVRHLESGSTVVVHVARPPGTFAEASVFADAYHCDAVAESASRVVAVRKASFLSALGRDPEASLQFARVLAGQVRDLRTMVELRNIHSAQERLMTWLQMQAVGAPPTVVLDRTWSDVAFELGLTREAIYRALAALERGQRLIRNEGKVRLPSPAQNG